MGLEKVMVFPVNAEGELVWGRLTLTCRQALVGYREGDHRNKGPQQKEMVSSFTESQVTALV